MHKKRWAKVSSINFIFISLVVISLIILLLTDKDGFIPILDHINLTFHEAGHGIFGILGNTLGLYGGTLGQLLVPGLIAGSFWKKGHTFPFALILIWFFQNFFNISRYVADARAQIIPLVGGGDHDWINILTRWNLLSSDTTIAGVFYLIGWLGIIFVWIWVGSNWHKYNN